MSGFVTGVSDCLQKECNSAMLANMEQASVNSPPLTDGYMRVSLIQLAQATIVQAQVMMAQASRDLVARPHQQDTMAPILGTSHNEPSYLLRVYG